MSIKKLFYFFIFFALLIFLNGCQNIQKYNKPLKHNTPLIKDKDIVKDVNLKFQKL